VIDEKESNYLHSLYRGLYLKRDIKAGEKICAEDLYSVIPYLEEKGQVSSRDFIEDDATAKVDIKKDSPLLRESIQ
jgi:sialic acid synthase SpsE